MENSSTWLYQKNEKLSNTRKNLELTVQKNTEKNRWIHGKLVELAVQNKKNDH